MGFDLKNYEEVKDRIPKFWKEHPAGAIRTTRLDSAPGEWVVHAALYRKGEDGPFATGLAHEITGQRGVNATSALENCETSAIGRALANGGFSSGPNRPSREEMGKVREAKGSGEGENATQEPRKAKVSDPYALHKQAALRAIQQEYPEMAGDEQKRLAKQFWVEGLDMAGDQSLETSKPEHVAAMVLALVKAQAPFT